ncbi:hypothetical protein OG689_41940 [Kitasatospora sp. NBC_00240]|uniref:hypothetical protein n=1 Tax=Kitasatospora sp. NBC_00240 TaxID=2903567 RepID=UPI00224E09E1|nr:hypothetical protein [Kitasatospora sp. NBC_00240]MCX5211156.1 hypothetical protein [Kitasatospora sp. NBC_00240]MCX5215721.1 hypothetical protein [Kitasatospora sp. NBC_00240]
MTVPRAWRNPEKIRHCRPRPVSDAPAQIADSKVGQLDFLLHRSGVLDLIDTELAGRPGPGGLPVRTVLVGLLLSLHHHQNACLADASRILLDQLSPTARGWLHVPDVDRGDPWARVAFSRRLSRSFDRLTTALDPSRADRRRRLPLAEAAAHAAAWEDDDPEHLRRRALLQEISDRMVLVTVRLAQRRGLFKSWRGDIGADTTAVPAWHHPPSDRRDLASVELTAGWHFSGGATEGVFGHSATLLVAASRRHPAGHPHAGERASKHPQLALGAVLDTPGKRVGPNAVHALTTLAPLGLPVGLLAADRAYTDQKSEHFQQPARRLGYQLALDYKQDQRGVQGTHLGALLIDGTLACPGIPDALANATTGLEDKAVRDLDQKLEQRLAKREPFFLKRKQGPDQHGTIRLQCPAAGPSPSVTCARFNRLHRPEAGAPAVVDLTNARSTAAHPSAKPSIQISPAERLRPANKNELPRICRKPTITVHPGDLGKLDKFRQDRHYLSPDWRDAYKPIRAHNEGLNGRAKGHRIDIADPKKRLAHGRVAQSLLLALMILMINLQILHDWTRTSSAEPIEAGRGQDYDGLTPIPLTTNGLPPPPG